MSIFRSLIVSLMLVLVSTVAFANRGGKANYDVSFLDRMIQHHEMGVSMAKMAQEKSTNQEVVKLSRQMEEDQNREIKQMREWRNNLFSNVPVTKQESHGMKMSELKNLSGRDFDQNYLSMMSNHHQMGIEMMQKAESKLSNEKLRNFAKEGAKKQAQEKQDIDHTKSSI